MKHYIRFGLWPADERSGIGTRFIFEKSFEEGVSVYDAEWDSTKNRWVISSEGFHSYIPTLDNFIGGGRDGRDIYLVTGDELDEYGTDGEPLLRNVKLVKKLSYADIYNKHCYEEDVILDLETSPIIPHKVTFLLKHPRSSVVMVEDALTSDTIFQHLGGYYQMYHILPGGIVMIVLELDYPEQNTDANIFWPKLGGVIFGPVIVTALASAHQMMEERKKLPWPWYQATDPDPEVEWADGLSIPGEEHRSLQEKEITIISKFLNKAGEICDDDSLENV